ncbi:MAG: hypothetical protein LUQ55_04095 [Methanomassiliicoccales archaeon]|nr:hypothetical protein [Methanomassiliicoccales archaeon]
MKVRGALPMFIPPLAFSQTSPVEVLTLLIVTLLGILLIREALRSLAGGLGRRALTPSLFCIAVATIVLLLARILTL